VKQRDEGALRPTVLNGLKPLYAKRVLKQMQIFDLDFTALWL
jgi:hypothetical protein